MSQSRSVSRSVSGGTVSVDAGYAQDLLDFWVQKYEQVKRELDYIKVRMLRCNSEDRWRASQLPLKPRKLLFLPPLSRHLERALTTAIGRANPNPRRRSESHDFRFPDFGSNSPFFLAKRGLS